MSSPIPIFQRDLSIPIPGWPGYLIDDYGAVWSEKSNQQMKWYSCTRKGDGRRWVVRLYQNGKKTTHYVHRLVALAFLPNPDNKPLVDHMDRNPGNNHKSNLRRATIEENNRNRRCWNRSGRKGIIIDKRNPMRIRYLVRIKEDGKTIQFGTYSSMREAIVVRNRETRRIQGEFACPD